MMARAWITPDWPAPPGVRAVCTTREGGVSAAPYSSLNLGDHVGDDPVAIAANRKALSDAIGAKPVFLQQVHGWQVAGLDEQTIDAPQADGCVTRQRGIACAIMVADCLPVLFATRDGQAVAAAHAGWRGLAGEDGRGVIETTVEFLLSQSGAAPKEVLVWLGPCIGPGAFEVGPEVKATFAADGQPDLFFKPGRQGKWLADLPALVRHRLQRLGVTQVFGNDGSTAWCTVSNPSRFFSHRRDGVSGRFAACVWLA